MGQSMPKPLPTVLLTRPLAQAREFAHSLYAADFGGEVVISPLLEIHKTGATVDLNGCSGVVFSSRQAVELTPVQDLPAWCVGDRTAQVARDAGWKAISAGGDAEALFEKICADKPAGPLMHIRGEHSRGKLAQRLTEYGIPCKETVLYQQNVQKMSDQGKQVLVGENPVILPLFSPRTARHFVQVAHVTAPLLVIAMSDVVANELKDMTLDHLLIASRPTADAMLEGIQILIDAA